MRYLFLVFALFLFSQANDRFYVGGAYGIGIYDGDFNGDYSKNKKTSTSRNNSNRAEEFDSEQFENMELQLGYIFTPYWRGEIELYRYSFEMPQKAVNQGYAKKFSSNAISFNGFRVFDEVPVLQPYFGFGVGTEIIRTKKLVEPENGSFDDSRTFAFSYNMALGVLFNVIDSVELKSYLKLRGTTSLDNKATYSDGSDSEEFSTTFHNYSANVGINFKF